MKDLTKEIRQLLDKAKEYEEMGRDFPTFGVGNIVESLEELYKLAQKGK